MSRAYKNRKKEIRKQKDLSNPERVRVRRLIQQGKLPPFMMLVKMSKKKAACLKRVLVDGKVETAPGVVTVRKLKILGTASVFHKLTAEAAE